MCTAWFSLPKCYACFGVHYIWRWTQLANSRPCLSNFAGRTSSFSLSSQITSRVFSLGSLRCGSRLTFRRTRVGHSTMAGSGTSDRSPWTCTNSGWINTIWWMPPTLLGTHKRQHHVPGIKAHRTRLMFFLIMINENN